MLIFINALYKSPLFCCCFFEVLEFCVYDANCAGMYGLPKPWYFPFTKSYWCGGSMRSVEECPNPFNLCRRGNGGFLSIIEDDQACAMAHQDPGKVGQENICAVYV